MIRAILPAILLVTLLAAAPVSPQNTTQKRSVTVTVEPAVSTVFGHTTYLMELKGYAEPGEVSYLASELKYPLDEIMGGLGLTVDVPIGAQHNLAIRIRAFTSFKDPGGTMTDLDWITIRDGFDGVFSSTESSVTGSSRLLDAEASGKLVKSRKTDIAALLGFRYQRISQDIDNFAGYQVYNEGNDTARFSVTDIPSLAYEVTYKMPYGGFRFGWIVGSVISSQASIAYGRVWADDVDNHLLRKKLATADGIGNGLLADISLKCAIGSSQRGTRSFISLDGELFTLSVKGRQEQVYYEDVTEIDPLSGEETEIPAGTTFSGIPHKFTSTQFRVGLTLRVMF